MTATALPVLPAAVALPRDKNPAAVYMASFADGNRSVKRGSAFIVPCFSVIELAGGFEYFVAGAGEKTAVGGW